MYELKPVYITIVKRGLMVDPRTEPKSSKSIANTIKSISLHSEYFEGIFSDFISPLSPSPTTSPSKLYYKANPNSPELTYICREVED